MNVRRENLPRLQILGTADEVANPVFEHDAQGLPPSYGQAIEKAGGYLTIATPTKDISSLEGALAGKDGLILTGGKDLGPYTYGEVPHPLTDPGTEANDFTQLALARLALERNIPVLGICRGMQALNVATEGNLHQHLTEVVGEDIDHLNAAKNWSYRHNVVVLGSSLLAQRLSGEEPSAGEDLLIKVSSKHHQAVARLGRGAVAVARADDGLIEAIEFPDRDFAIGVQWHSEAMPGDLYQENLLSSFVNAASAFQLEKS